jgi:Ca2+-binding RTX toxin-like protein
MRRVSVGFAAAATMALALAGAPSASAQEQLAASCEPAGSNTYTNLPDAIQAQSFTSALGGPLTRAEVFVRQGAPGTAGTAGDYTVGIWDVDSSGSPTTMLASTTVPDENLPLDQLVTLSASFAAPANLVAGQTYAVSISRALQYTFFVRGQADCPGHSRNSTTGGATWGNVESDDMVFRVFVTLPQAATSTCRGDAVTIPGTESNDELSGTPGRDVIAGLGGKDVIRGLRGKDVICGGKGKDILRGGKGKDKLYGQGGKDKLVGGGGKDRCVGGRKDDSAKKCEVEKSI